MAEGMTEYMTQKNWPDEIPINKVWDDKIWDDKIWDDKIWW